MPVVEIRCPNCGSVCSQKGVDSNEYACSHCGSVFRFVDNTKRTLTRDVAIRGCLYCGKPLEQGKGFRCTKCGREYFCESCVDFVSDRYVCIECISKANQNCQLCKKYAVYKCISCGRRACKNHPYHVGFTYNDLATALVLFCPRCRGFVCTNCAHPSFLSGLRCPRCGTGLVRYQRY